MVRLSLCVTVCPHRRRRVYTRGGSVSRSKWRCLASAAMKASRRRLGVRSRRCRPGSGLPVRQRRSESRRAPAASAPSPSDQDRLAVAVLILQNSSTRPSARARRPPSSPSGNDHRVEEHRRRRLERWRRPRSASPVAGSHRAERRPTNRGTAPSAASAARRAPRSGAPSHAVGDEDRDAPRADAAVARPREQRQRRRLRHLRRDRLLAAPSASAPACSRMPRPCGDRLGQLRRDVHQARHHALANRRRLHLRQLEAEGVDDVRLLDRRSGCSRTASPACSDRRTARPCRAPCDRPARAARETRRSPPRRPGTDSRRRASSARRRRGRGGSPGGACRRAGCCAPARSAR